MLKQVVLGAALLVIAACEPGKSEDLPSAPAATADSETQPVHELWVHSCALCHVDGNAGAPRIGNAQEWLPRLAQGAEVLLQHTLEGFNQMPPLGYCMACEREDFVALIDFMTRGVEREHEAALQQQEAEAAQ